MKSNIGYTQLPEPPENKYSFCMKGSQLNFRENLWCEPWNKAIVIAIG